VRSGRTNELRSSALRRALRAECLEPRRLMAADPIHVGIVYIETDYLESVGGWGSDEIPDRFILSFTGGAPKTELKEFRISLDKDQDGLSIGDLIFDTAPGGFGKARWHPFKVTHTDSVTGAQIKVAAEVQDGTTELLVRLTNFKAGDLLEFSIDVDEVLRMHKDLDRFNAALDVIASGQEFQDSLFWADFVAPHYEPVTAHALFVNDFGDPAAEFGIRIPPDEGPSIDSRPSRSAAAVAHANQTPKPISIAGTVWVDDNLNLKRDAGEPVLPGVLVSLLRKDPSTGQFVDTGHVQVTNAAGAYHFGTNLGLMPGEYQVVQTQPANYFSVGAVVGLIGGKQVGQASSSNILTGINLPLGDLHAVNYDFAEARPANVSGFVYRDDNDNGRRDPGEPGLGGVTMRLVPLDTLAPINPMQTITAADGSYTFTTLPPGRYDIIQVTQPTGLDDGRDSAGTVDGRPVGVADLPGDAIRGVVLQGNSRGINYNFGELPRGIITGGVYLTAPGQDCGGRDDGRSTPLAGVQLELVGPGGVTVARTTTGLDGQYRFDNVSKGIYSIIEVTPAGLLDGKSRAGTINGITVGTAVDGGLIGNIALPAGATATHYDFCEAAPGKISGYVYHDKNQNAKRDSGEQPIPGSTIQLVNQTGQIVATTQTNAQGFYEFKDLIPGNYSIRQIQPLGYLDGLDSAGTIDGVAVGTAVNPGDVINAVLLRQGQTGINYNFGELMPASLSGRVHVDANDNCTYDPGELLLAGVVIRLLDFTGHEVARTTTNDAGQYKFEGIAPGTYTVVQTQPEGYFSGTAKPGSAGGAKESPDRIGNITLGSAEVAVDYDFCEKPPAEISGFVYHDQNMNQRRDSGEIAIAGVRIDLLDSTGKQVATTTTNASGFYRFTFLPAGQYTLRQTQPAGYLQGSQQAGSAGGDASVDDVISKVPVVYGAVLTQYNFGELQTASISGRVHVDDNDNCTYDPGERLLAGVLIQILDSAGREVARTTTNDAGQYKFEGLVPGTYTIVETQPEGFFSGTAKPGSAGGVKESPDRIGNITLGSGEVAVDYDFCEKPPAEISGFVYVDQNMNQRRDSGEAAIAGVRIDLLDSTGKQVATTTTNSSGFYRFTFLPAGQYTLRQAQPVGYLQGSQQAGSAGGDATVADVISKVPIAYGAVLTQYNFGELQTASISGRVHVDDNGNCTYDPGERLLTGVVIQIFDSAGREVARTTTNDAGQYKFEGLIPGTYTIVETQPEGFFSGTAKPGSAGGVKESPDRIGSITLGSGEVAVDYDFCEKPPAEISGFVYVDQNNNQRRDSGEAAIAGVRVDLLDASGKQVATTTTAADGFYRFTFLPAGQYTLRQTQPVGYLQGSQQAGSAGGNAFVDNVISEVPILYGAILTQYNFGELLPAAISGYVFVDGNGDCIRQDDEPGLAGVLIELFDGAGQLVTFTRTNDTGFYRFEGLSPGQYRIVETQPVGYKSGAARPGSGGGRAEGSDIITEIPIFAGANLTDYNFCEKLPATISGQVFADSNLNKRRDQGEQPIAGVVIELRDTNNNVVGTTQTDGNGFYQFTDLNPGTYSLRQYQPGQYFHGGQVAGNLGGNDSLDDVISTIVLPGGAIAVDYDFPEVPPATISGYVFQDGPPLALMNSPDPADLRQYRDGIRRPGDQPIAGVTMQLRNILGRPISADRAIGGIYDGTIQVVTDANGYYEFVGLRPGSYHVYQIQPDGYIDSLDTPGTTGGVAVNVADLATNPQTLALLNILTASPQTNPYNDAILNISLVPGGHSQENNFSEIRVEMPVPPIVPPTPGQEFSQPLSELFPTVVKIASFGDTDQFRRPIVADAEYLVTWHLSIINGGYPRGNGTEAGFHQASSREFDESFVPGSKQTGRWLLVDRQGNRVEVGHEFTLGEKGAIPLIGDFNGDGLDQIAIYSNGQWFVDLNGNGVWDEGDLWLRMGTTLDRPVVGDWDGDGKADIAIFGRQWLRDPEVIVDDPGLPSPANKRRREHVRTEATKKVELEHERMLRRGSRGSIRTDAIDHVFRYGEQPDTPLAGDWNGDGIDSVAIFRAGEWTLDTDGDGRLTDRDDQVSFGEPGDIPIAGDWNGDGITNLGVIRGDVWIIDSDGDRRITGNDIQIRIPKPHPEAQPIVGDWDGDGTDEFGWFQDAG
jgi:serine-aspartate repeat-containing protein C/D/E